MRQRRFLTPAQRAAQAAEVNFAKSDYCPKHNVYYAKLRCLGSRVVKQGYLSCYTESHRALSP